MITKEILKALKENYERACNAYLNAFLRAWEYDSIYGYWLCNRVGETYCYGDNVFLSMEEIIFILENNIKEDEYLKYLDYCERCREFNFNAPNFENYHNGCPLVPQERFTYLSGLKEELEKACEETKQGLNKPF